MLSFFVTQRSALPSALQILIYTSTLQFPLMFEPDPAEWLSTSRIDSLKTSIKGSKEILALSGLLFPYLSYWVRREIYTETQFGNSDVEQQQLRLEIDQWKLDNPKVDLSEDVLDEKIRIKLSTEKWMRAQWESLLPSLFIRYRNSLDRIF